MNINRFSAIHFFKKIKEIPMLPISVFIVTFAVYYPFSLIGVDPHHDGIMLKSAMDVLSGQVLFRDTFDQYGALTTYLQAFSLFSFGASLKVLKISTVFFYALSGSVLSL